MGHPDIEPDSISALMARADFACDSENNPKCGYKIHGYRIAIIDCSRVMNRSSYQKTGLITGIRRTGGSYSKWRLLSLGCEMHNAVHARRTRRTGSQFRIFGIPLDQRIRLNVRLAP